MKHKVTFGKVTINLENLPEKKADFDKLYKGKIPDVDKAWKEVSSLRKKIK